MSTYILFPHKHETIILFSSLNNFFFSKKKVIFVYYKSITSSSDYRTKSSILTTKTYIYKTKTFSCRLFKEKENFFQEGKQVFILCSTSIKKILYKEKDMAQYIMEEMPDIHKTGERVLYPRFAMIDQIDFNGLVRRITDTSGFKPGEIEGILKQAALEMAKLMANGCSVKLDGIGTFTPALTLREGKEREEIGETGKHRNAQSIIVGGVNFRVDRSMIRNINERCYLEKANWKSRRSSEKYTPEQRLERAIKYLDEHPYLTVREYQKLTGLLRTTATNELKQWAKLPDSGIDTSGRGAHRVYIKQSTKE